MPMRADLASQLTAKILEVAEQATPEERQKVADWIARAIASAGHPVIEFHEVTPAIAALLFLEHNHFNREWDANWSHQLSRIMEAGGWRITSQGYALYGDNGDVGDGSHRMAAQAVSGTTLVMAICFGISKEAVGTLDCGKRRTVANAAELAGIVNATAKSSLLKAIWAYERSVGMPVPVAQANVPEVVKYIKQYDVLLARAIELAQTSLMDAYDPLLRDNPAAKIIGILLRHSWPEGRVTERLDEIQTSDFADEKAPLAVARKFIESHRKPKDVIDTSSESGVVIKGMLMAEVRNSVNRKGEQEIANAADHPPDPTYPSGPPQIGFGNP
jgi:hypothetical protein